MTREDYELAIVGHRRYNEVDRGTEVVFLLHALAVIAMAIAGAYTCL